MTTLNGTNYLGNHIGAPQILQGTPMYNVEVAEGWTPPGEYYPAFYLNAAVSENRLQGSAYVLMPGKVLALDKDSRNRNGRLIPAGLADEITLWHTTKASAAAAYITAEAADAGNPTAQELADADAAGIVAATAAVSIVYGGLDEEFGIVNAAMGRAVAGDKVAAIAGALGITATRAIGIAKYAALTAPGTDPSNPSTFFKHSYDTGGSRSFSRWGFIQVPVLETQVRVEDMREGATTHRILLYVDGALTFKDDGPLTVVLTEKATPNLLTPVAAGNPPTEFSTLGRTIFFNGVIPAGWTVTYQPQLDTPFTCLKVDGSTLANSVDLIGEKITYDANSNYAIGATNKFGEILDVKLGQDKDLATVMTWYRDQGKWQEQPGSSTEGRNTQLALANAPRYIARIAFNFNQGF